MAGNIIQKFGTSAQTLTCQLAPGGVGLANKGARESTVVDKTSDLFQEVRVQTQSK